MFQWSRNQLLLFSSLLLLAFGIYLHDHFNPDPRQGDASLASKSKKPVKKKPQTTEQTENPKDEVTPEKVVAMVDKVLPNPSTVVEQCANCDVGVMDQTAFDYEDSEKCKPGRKLIEKGFQKLPEVFKGERTEAPADFPRTCLIFMLKNTMGNGASARRDLVYCASTSHQPIRSGWKSCVTPIYVNTIYNYFGDVTNCMAMPQKDFLPKIFNESGFHVNAYGAGGDTGIGQLTAPAISEANKKFNYYKEQILDSGLESCQRLAPQLKKMSALSAFQPRCGFVAPTDNPLRNMIYMGIKYHQDLDLIEKGLKDLKVIERMSAMGLKEDQYDKVQLYQILQTLGYNSGAYTGVILLSNYLKTRARVTKADFDFSRGVNMKTRKLTITKANAASFPAYLMTHQHVGTAGYLSRVQSYANDLNKVFKEGVCVPEKYLSL